ncbi:MAG: hypothetical protein ACRDVN_14765 [Jiangellaceae bacterium]
MRDDTDTQNDGSDQLADQATDDPGRIADPDAEQAERDAGSDLRSDEDTEAAAAAPMTEQATGDSEGGDSNGLMPGDLPAEPAPSGWAEGAAEDMRTRWQDLQLRFVDDPPGVAGEARSLVDEAVRAITDALADQQRRLDSWSTAEGGDTEQLRVVVQRYRDFFDRMLDRAV